MHRVSRVLVASALPLSLVANANADLVTWGPVQVVTAATDVSTTGTLVAAQNPWAQTFAAPTVNGVPFSAFAPLGWNNGGWLLLAGSSTGDTGYDALLDSARATSETSQTNPTGWGGIQLDGLGVLTIGNQYEIQVWYSDQRTGSATNVLYEREMTLSSATGNAALTAGVVTNLTSLTQGPLSAPLNADPNDLNGPTDTEFGSFAIGTFTRTTNDPLWLLIQGSNSASSGGLRPHINAFQIRDVTGTTLGMNYCMANPNSTGSTGSISAAGSATAASNDVTLTASDLPNNAFGFFITSQTQGFVANPNGSAGNLCVLGAIGRYVGAGQIQTSGSVGEFNLTLDLTQTPTPTGFVTVMASDTWNFQAWHRDSSPTGPTSNFTDGLEVTFN